MFKPIEIRALVPGFPKLHQCPKYPKTGITPSSDGFYI